MYFFYYELAGLLHSVEKLLGKDFTDFSDRPDTMP